MDKNFTFVLTPLKKMEEMTLSELQTEYFRAVDSKDYAKSAKILEHVKTNYSK